MINYILQDHYSIYYIERIKIKDEQTSSISYRGKLPY